MILSFIHLAGILYREGTAALCIVSGAEHHHIGLYLFVAFGAYSGWCYLRYFQLRCADGADRAGSEGVDVEGGATGGVQMRGDSSEEFAFAAQFPVFLQPILRRLTDPCHALFCAGTTTTLPHATSVGRRGRARGAATGSARHPGIGGPMSPPPTGGAMEDTAAERRKQLASRGARLLAERMARASATQTAGSGTPDAPPAAVDEKDPTPGEGH